MATGNQLLKYETYVNDILKQDLRKVCDEIDRVNNDLAEYEQLNKTITMMTEYKEQKETFKSLTDIGCSFFMQTQVNDFSAILLNIGKECYLEFSLTEAQKFTETKENFLHSRLNALREKSAKIKAHIKLMLLYMNTLSSQSSV